MHIRRVTPTDCAAIADLYAHYVTETVATFDYETPTVEAWQAKRIAITDAGRPFLVAVDDGPTETLLGFAYLGPFRDKRAYAYTAEDTIYLAPAATGRGIGSALLSALLAAADPANVRQVIAVIAADGGDASIALHAAQGFEEVGRTPAVGHKFGRWIDCVYMQRAVG